MPRTDTPAKDASAKSAPTQGVAYASIINGLSEFSIPFHVENLSTVTGLGLGSTRSVRRPGFDGPPVAANQIEVNIAGGSLRDQRICFDAIELDKVDGGGSSPRGLNRLISVVAEVSSIRRADMKLLLRRPDDGEACTTALVGLNPYAGSDVDARLEDAFKTWKSGEGQNATDDAKESWWARKRKELDERDIKPVSVADLIRAITQGVPQPNAPFSFNGHVIMVTEADSELWQQPEWNRNVDESTAKSLCFALKTPRKMRGTHLERLELECRLYDDEKEDWYILDIRSGGTIVSEDVWANRDTAINIWITLNAHSVKTCGLKLEPDTMYELRARYIFKVDRIGERESPWVHKTARTKPAPNRCRVLVETGGADARRVRPRVANLDDDEDDDEESEEEVRGMITAQRAGQKAPSHLMCCKGRPLYKQTRRKALKCDKCSCIIPAKADFFSCVYHGCTCDYDLCPECVDKMSTQTLVSVPPENAAAPPTPAEVSSATAALDKIRLQMWLAGKRGTGRPDFSGHYDALVELGCDSIEMLFALTEADLQTVETIPPLRRAVLLRFIGKQGEASSAGGAHQIICPITQRAPTEPVRAADGHVYERAAIENWLLSHDTSPLTHVPLANKDLVDA